MQSSSSESRPWFARPGFQAAAWILVGIALIQGVVTIFYRDNDFRWHCEHGQRFLAGIIDRDHYLPARGLLDVALAVGPYRLTAALAYLASLSMLLVCWRLWDRMAAHSATATAAMSRVAGFFAVLLLLPYLQRDLDECGLQVWLLFFLTMGGFALSRGRGLQAGFWLGTAAIYKVTPLLCLPFLLWKRQWRAAGWMTVFLVAWCAAPALVSGWAENVRTHKQWWADALRLRSAHQAYPSLLEREPPQIYNLSLYAAIARWLETYPPGHPLYLQDPWFVQVGHFTSEKAYLVQQGILGILALLFAWKTRAFWNDANPAATFPGEWAAICALCALLSPLCWKHHFAIVLPCAFLVLRNMATAASIARLRIVLICAIGTVAYLCRDFAVGRQLASVLLSYKVDTLAVCTLVVWALVLRRPAAGIASGIRSDAATLLPRAA
jgi:hypothetical protein